MSLRAVKAVDLLLAARAGQVLTAADKTGYVWDGLKAIQEHVTQRRCKEKSQIEEALVGRYLARLCFWVEKAAAN